MTDFFSGIQLMHLSTVRIHASCTKRWVRGTAAGCSEDLTELSLSAQRLGNTAQTLGCYGLELFLYFPDPRVTSSLGLVFRIGKDSEC